LTGFVNFYKDLLLSAVPTQNQECDPIAMLPTLHQEQYQELRQRLQALLDRVGTLQTRESEGSTLAAAISEMQQFFQSQVVGLPTEGLAPADESRTQSYNTELHKQLRLLASDAMFLGSARQGTTLHQRLDRVRDRLALLIRYCDTLLDNLE
jgi:inactivated superfamily I helicase